MQRLHVNLKVADINASIEFYTSLFSADPTVRKPDYARWMLEDPRVNFSLSECGSAPGVAHLGIQAETSEELEALYERVGEARGPVIDEGETTCCYAQSTKQWITDPQGVLWEAFQTHGDGVIHGHRRSAG